MKHIENTEKAPTFEIMVYKQSFTDEKLPDMDSNHDCHLQRVECYRYTIRE